MCSSLQAFGQRQIKLDDGSLQVEASFTPIPVGSDWVKRLQKRTNQWSGQENTEPLESTLKLGLAGYMVSIREGAFQHLEGTLNTTVHAPVKEGTFLSLGISTGLSNHELDLSKVTVRNPANDLTYQSYLQNGTTATFLNMGSSIALY